jgi:hypothetical protein
MWTAPSSQGVLQRFDQIAVMSVFNRQERKTPSGIFGVRLILPMQACAVEGGH